jgi:type I restriction enzyme S subunit
MTPNDLIAAFDVLADAPDGVKRLRELVLSLAVRGKLVGQDPEDEPASAALSACGKPRSAMSGPYELPHSWEWARFTEVAEIASNLVDPAAYTDEPHVAPDSIEKGTGRLLGFRTIGEDGVRSGKHRFFPGQILYSKIRPNLSKVVVVEFAGLCSADMYPINPRIDRGYLHRFMLSWPFLMQVTADDNRLAMPKVNQTQLSSVLVATPPLAEQHRIVARVDELMGLLDRLEAARATRDSVRRAARDAALADLRDAPDAEAVEAAWGRIAQNMDDLFTDPEDVGPLRQAVLQLAVRGRLVSQEISDGSADAVLRSVEEERSLLVAGGRLRRASTSTGAGSDSAPPFEIPASWRWARAADIALVITDGDHQPPPRADQGFPFIVIGNVSGGGIDLSDTRLVSAAYFESLDWTKKPTRADLLYTVTGSFGLVIPVGDEPAFCVQRHIGIIKTANSANVTYLMCVLRSAYAQKYAADVATGIAQKTVPLGGLRRLPVPVPPLAEQHRIVTRVDELMSLCDTLEARLTAARDLHRQFAAAAVHHLDM